ncbi:MAG: hypothetical protein E7527_02305 [Ruminococcaceae bacterium]|nr:hypothetical protein [Oscillospiraceae bacterium]
MKKALSLCLVVLLCLTFAACGDEDKAAAPAATDNAATTDAALVGTWVAADGETAIFNADATGSIDGDPFDWSVSGNKLTVTEQNGGTGKLVFTYAVAGNTLTLTNDEGSSMVYNKTVASAEPSGTTAPTQTPDPVTPTVANPSQVVSDGSDLIGIWKADDGLVMTINADGTGSMDDDAITWSVSGSTLALTEKASGETISVVYGTSGDTLTFFTPEGIVIMMFTKQ